MHGPEQYGLIESRTAGHHCASLDRSHGAGDDIPVVVESDSFTRRDWRQMKDLANALAYTERNHPRTVAELIATPSPDEIGPYQNDTDLGQTLIPRL